MYAFEDVAKTCHCRKVTILSSRVCGRKIVLEAEASAELLLNGKLYGNHIIYKVEKIMSAEIVSLSTCLIYLDNFYKD